jgi:hypothetical protein
MRYLARRSRRASPFALVLHLQPYRRSQVFFSRRHLQKDPTQGMQWAYFQGFAPPRHHVECTVVNRKRFAKPLKIRPPALNAIDVVLKRMPVTQALVSQLRPCASRLASYATWLAVALSPSVQLGIMGLPNDLPRGRRRLRHALYSMHSDP